MATKARWTEDQDELLVQIYPIGTKDEIMSKIGRTWPAIKIRATAKGLKRDKDIVLQEMAAGSRDKSKRDDLWTDEEMDYIKSSYRCTSREEMLSRLPGRNWIMIRQKAVRMKLVRDPEVIRRENAQYSQKGLMERHGVKSSFSLISTKEKIRKAHLERRGVEYPTQSPEVRRKVKDTVLERYGTENVFQAREVKEATERTNIKRYGHKSPLQNEDVKKKLEQTCVDRYNVRNTFMLTDRVREGMEKKYRVSSPLKSPEIRKKWVETNREKYGADHPCQNPEVKERLTKTMNSPEVRAKKAAAMRGLKCSDEEKELYIYLREVDPGAIHQEVHPVYKWLMDYYLPKYDLWVQYDGVYWHGKNGLAYAGRHADSIKRTMKNDKLQNESIPNLVRFWSDDVSEAIKEGRVLEFIRDKINSVPRRSHQHIKKTQLYMEDVRDLPFNPDNVKASDFELEAVRMSPEIEKFIERYEWLGSSGNKSKWCFTARYRDILSGVLIINEPNAYSKLLGESTARYEALIQRGATISWAPRNLGSKLVMYACHWMVQNTDKRFFVAYADPQAAEVGFIYQACNFDFLGGGYGTDFLYRHPKIKKKEFGKQYLSRTSSFKGWCREHGVEFSKEWLTTTGYKDLSKIPQDIKDAWDAWKRRILSEAERIRQLPKYKYALLLARDRREMAQLETLKVYQKKDYIKGYGSKKIPDTIKYTGMTADRKTRAKLSYIEEHHSKMSRRELAKHLNESERWIKRQIKRLIGEGKLTPKRS